MARIACEDSLGNVKQMLQENGHEVLSMEAGNINDCDCCVISGQDKDVMGMQDVSTNMAIINAEGMSAEEVVQQVNERTS